MSTCRSFIYKIDGLIGEVAVIDISCGKPYRCLYGIFRYLDIMMVFILVLYALEDTYALFL